MRIALLSPVWYPVPPPAYGGVERVVALLAQGLAARGHEVTLFASGDSQPLVPLVSVYDTAPTARLGQTTPELLHALACMNQADQFDLVHDHSGPLAAALAGATATPTLHTVHGALDSEIGATYASVAAISPRLSLASLSNQQRSPRPGLPWLATCYNGLDLDEYPLSMEREPYLAFLGRMNADKGVLEAIEIAKAAGRPLRIACKMHEPAERAYFESVIRPHLSREIEYVGEVGHADKVQLLGRASALLFPISWDEPFGLVTIEALACGTPVLATRRGAVPEIVEHGRTGFVVDEPCELVRYVQLSASLDPATCRHAVASRFTADHMVDAYERAYERMLASNVHVLPRRPIRHAAQRAMPKERSSAR